MARRRKAPIRPITPDPLFESELIAKFTRCIMKDGKKSVAERIVYGALDQVQQTLFKKVKSDVATAQKMSGEEEDEERGGRTSGGKGENIFNNQRARDFALEKFKEVLEKISPIAEVRSRRVGGATYQVPVEIRPKRRMALAMRWLVENAYARNDKTMMLRLAHEILDALEGRGGALKKKEAVHRMAKANLAFSHYRW